MSRALRKWPSIVMVCWVGAAVLVACGNRGASAGQAPTTVAPKAGSPAPGAALVLPTAAGAGTVEVSPPLNSSLSSTRLETTTIGYKLDTFETEETVGHEVSRLPGVRSFVTGQAEITVSFDPAVTNRDRIVRALQDNPEVRVEDP